MQFRVLGHDVSSYRWQVCFAPWIPLEELTCPATAIPVGEGQTCQWVVPDGVEGAWIRVDHPDDPQVIPAVRQVIVGDEGVNPDIDGLESEGDGLPLSVSAGSALDVDVIFGADIDTSEFVINYYTTHGKFSPFRTSPGVGSSWEVGEEAGAAHLVVVVRDPFGGVSWIDHDVQVAP